jgi:hypothetical protein
MTSVKKFGDFFIGGILVLGLIPLLTKGINILRPRLGEAETLVLSLIPLMIVGRWLFSLFDSRRVVNNV